MAEVKTISFRAAAKKISDLDALGEVLERDRSYLINEAIDNYLQLMKYQIEQIQEGIRQADQGRLVEHAEVRKLASSWRSKH